VTESLFPFDFDAVARRSRTPERRTSTGSSSACGRSARATDRSGDLAAVRC
jgi:hypothetical protein